MRNNSRQKLCSRCSRPAQWSFLCMISSVGASPRLQKSTRTVLFCDDCFEQLCKSEGWGTDELREAVNSALTAINRRSVEHSSVCVRTDLFSGKK
jgi:hypothetical protein